MKFPVDQFGDVFRVMEYTHHRHAFVLEQGKATNQGSACRCVEGSCGFVEQQQLARSDQRPCEIDLLLLAARKSGRVS